MKFKKFSVSNSNPNGLFTCSRGTRLTKLERKPGNIPLLTAGVGEGQGVAQFIEETPKMTLYKNDITIDMFGLVYYHDYEHYGDDNIHFLVNDSFSHKVKLYITTVIEKALNGYSYGNQFRMADLNDLVISLPIHNILCPDFKRLQDIVGMGGGVDMTTIDTSSWKEFSYEDLFELVSISKRYGKNHIIENGKVPIYSSDTTNNGVIGYGNIEPSFIVNETTPAYLVFGDHTRTMNIVRESFCVTDTAKVLKPKYIMSDEVLLFIITVWKKGIVNLGYARHWSVAKDVKIKLPVKEVEEIDFDYMEKYIAELEGQRIAELEGYLVATGLNDYVLTEEDKQILSLSLQNQGLTKIQIMKMLIEMGYK